MRKFILTSLNKNLGEKRMQKVYQSLLKVALEGMNYGNSGNFKKSGELNVVRYISNKLNQQKPLTIFDVGGNVGEYSKSVAEEMGKDAVIHAFEPSKKTYERFLKTTAGLENVLPNNFGFSDTEGKLILYTNSDESGLASVYQRNLEHFGIDMNKSEEIRLSTIDGYCMSKGIDRIHFLKLDVEGHELSALKGASRMLENNSIDYIQFEFGGCNIDSRTYFQDFYYLLRDKFRIYRVLRDGLAEIEDYSEKHEIFITINYLAERRG